MSAGVFCSSKRESIKRTSAPKDLGWSQDAGNGEGRGTADSVAISTSRKRLVRKDISSEKRSLPDSRKPTWLEKLSISERSCEEMNSVDSAARSRRLSMS